MKDKGSDKKTLGFDTGDEGVRKLQTVGFRTMDEDDIINESLRDELEDMDKEDLVKLITDLGKNELRHTNYNILVMNERKQHFKQAVEDLEKSVEEKKAKAEKYKSIGKDPQRTIKALEKTIVEEKNKIEVLQKKVDQFEQKKSVEEAKQQKAKALIDKKLVK